MEKVHSFVLQYASRFCAGGENSSFFARLKLRAYILVMELLILLLKTL